MAVVEIGQGGAGPTGQQWVGPESLRIRPQVRLGPPGLDHLVWTKADQLQSQLKHAPNFSCGVPFWSVTGFLSGHLPAGHPAELFTFAGLEDDQGRDRTPWERYRRNGKGLQTGCDE